MKFPFSANNKNKPNIQFASWFSITLATIIFLIILFLLFPKKELLHNLAQQKKADMIALKYLKNLLILYPHSFQLHLLIANQNISYGDIKKAIAEIKPYIKQNPKTKNDWQALWLYYQIVKTITYAEPKISYTRLRNLEKLRILQIQLSQGPLAIKQLLQLAQDALATGDPKLALELYKKIEPMPSITKLSIKEYLQAAKLTLSYGEYNISAKFYFLAQQHAKTLNQKRKYFIDGLKTLQSGNLLTNIMQIAQQHIGELQNDNDTLIFLTNLAVAANQPDIAERYMKKVIQLEHLPLEQEK